MSVIFWLGAVFGLTVGVVVFLLVALVVYWCSGEAPPGFR